MNKGLIGDHYWVINGFGGEPPIEEQIIVAKEEIAEYENKQQVAKDTWTDEEWKDEAKLYEFWLYKNMVFYWERVLKTLQEDHSIKITDEIVELEDSDFSI
jgi:hypothetical protein